MTLPATVFVLALWAAIAAVALAAAFLVVVLIREWRDGSLW